MRPNFKNIDIKSDAFNVKHAPIAEGEKWVTPELIPVKPIYTKADLEGLEHLNYVAGIPPFLRGPYSGMYAILGQSANTQVSPQPLSQTHSTAATLLPDRKVCQWHSTWLHTVATTLTTHA